jgi:hypothetical protein
MEIARRALPGGDVMKWLPAPTLVLIVAALAWTSAVPARHQQRSDPRGRPAERAAAAVPATAGGGEAGSANPAPGGEPETPEEPAGGYLIAGRVVDSALRPIAGAEVLLREGSG